MKGCGIENPERSALALGLYEASHPTARPVSRGAGRSGAEPVVTPCDPPGFRRSWRRDGWRRAPLREDVGGGCDGCDKSVEDPGEPRGIPRAFPLPHRFDRPRRPVEPGGLIARVEVAHE